MQYQKFFISNIFARFTGYNVQKISAKDFPKGSSLLFKIFFV